MKRTFVGLVATIVGAVACGNPTGPTVTGRWAARGIELIASARSAELHLPCTLPIRVPPWRRVDANGQIRFSGAVRQQWWNFAYTFEGQVQRDTLTATLTITVAGQQPSVADYLMTRDGDSRLDGILCLTSRTGS